MKVPPHLNHNVTKKHREVLEKTENTLFAIGTGTISLERDRVRLIFSIQNSARTASEALDQNNNDVNAVLQSLSNLGLPNANVNISTSSFTITPIENYTSTPQEIISYTVENSIEIISSSLNDISSWIDAAVTAGADDVSLSFFVSDERIQASRNPLIKNAVGDAKSQAQFVANELGVTLNGIKSVSVDLGNFPVFLQSQPTMELSTTPLIPGQSDISVSVSVTWLI